MAFYWLAGLNFEHFQNETKNWKLPECGSFKNRIIFDFRTYSAVLLLKTAAQLPALKIISAKRESFGVKNRSIICHLKVELLFVINVISLRMITCHTSLNKTVCYCTMKGSWRGIFAPKGLYMDRNRNKLEKVCPLTFETDCWQILVTKLTPSPTIEVDLIWERSWNVLAVERAQIYAFTGYILD